MEEHVNELADLELAISVKTANMERATEGTDQRIADLEHDLEVLREHRADVAAPFVIGIADDERHIDEIKAQIIDEWTGEHKTMVFDAGTLKFRQTGSLKIIDGKWLLADLLDRTSIDDVADKYLKGFNLTAVKKYMGVHELPIDVAEIKYKTTVNLTTE